MRVAALADLHGHFPRDVPDCDVIALAGDIVLHNPSLSGKSQGMELRRQLYAFRDWLNSLNRRGIVVVGCAGNHDFGFQELPDLPGRFNWHYLEDSGTEINGVKFWGSPWQPWMSWWAFNAPEEEFDNPLEPFLNSKFKLIPEDTDVLITHSPPAGFHDTVKGYHAGSIALNKHVERVLPKLHVYGHIHKPGVIVMGDDGADEAVIMCNAAYVGFDRRPNGHPIMVFDV